MIRLECPYTTSREAMPVALASSDILQTKLLFYICIAIPLICTLADCYFGKLCKNQLLLATSTPHLDCAEATASIASISRIPSCF